MEALARAIIVVLPLLVVFLLAGLGLIIHVIAHEGRAWSTRAARIVGVFDILLATPFVALALTAEASDVRGMFVFSALAFAGIGLGALRAVARYDAEVGRAVHARQR